MGRPHNYCIHQPGRAASGPDRSKPAGPARPAGDACVSQPRGRTMVALLMTLLVLGSVGTARAADSLVTIDAEYVQALQTADLFLWAWQTCDFDLGLQLISRPLQSRLEQDPSRDFLQYIEGLSNPHHAAFEITGGKALGPTRFAFSVALFDHYQGNSTATRYDSTIELVLDPDASPIPDSVLVRSLRPELASHFRVTEALHWKVDVLPEAR